jgi:hypothetical protein
MYHVTSVLYCSLELTDNTQRMLGKKERFISLSSALLSLRLSCVEKWNGILSACNLPELDITSGGAASR